MWMAAAPEEGFLQFVPTTKLCSLTLSCNFLCFSRNSFDPRFPSVSLDTSTSTGRSTQTRLDDHRSRHPSVHPQPPTSAMETP